MVLFCCNWVLSAQSNKLVHSPINSSSSSGTALVLQRLLSMKTAIYANKKWI